MDLHSPRWILPLLVILTFAGLEQAQEINDNDIDIPLKIPSFQCGNEKTGVDAQQIDRNKVCDGTADCKNSADEDPEICTHIRCPPNYFQCDYGACVSQRVVCNGFNDCVDRSDEAYCGRDVESCNYGDYPCKSGQCINAKLVCDGKVDCGDGTDETDAVCAGYPCPSHSYRCSYGGCVSSEAICNGVVDCRDQSDELAALCKGNCSSGTQGSGKCIEGCKKNEFRCSSGSCIPQNKVCNGIADCPGDGFDESPVVCKTFNCPAYAFRCTYGACIEATLACNGASDCVDGSDESTDLCEIQRPEKSCILPPFPTNGRHNVATGAYMANLGALNFSCNPGFELKGDSIIYCYEGLWVPSAPTCEAIKGGIRCPGLKSRHLNMECFLASGAQHPCDQPAPEGTVATYSCRQFYEPNSNYPNRRSVCSNGTWSRELLQCVPDCGRTVGKVTPLVVNGTAAEYGEWPWQVALYVRIGGRDGVPVSWEFQCGGSLVAENIVLTAAHCVWEVKTDAMVAALGKYHRDYTRRQELTQIKELKEIIMNPSYLDRQGNYESDIALLVLSSPVTLTAVAQPVCLDWDDLRENLDLSPPSIGTVVGWGVTENDTPSEIPRKANLPVINFNQCLQDLPQDFAKYIRSTTFCAGYLNRTSVCNGDSGGGLMFKKDDGSWVLQGVVSVSPRRKDISLCDPRYYAIFTRVSRFIKWVITIMEKHSPPP
ncbi:modular serine protease-like [Ischnura elegans]|uniref:modular serine protease-like n=1 Tax=Ischnura elegans TaxID=197161 RepID=UPI001ED8BA54|nr:modular serine protease-like [Ischnura elegans]